MQLYLKPLLPCQLVASQRVHAHREALACRVGEETTSQF
jgi:hypothetical protein